MERFNNINPFVKRDSHSPTSVITYKVLTLVSWVLSVVASVYYWFEPVQDGLGHIHDTIPGWNNIRPSGFTLNNEMLAVYWLVLLVLQLAYASHLFSTKVETVNAACAVGSHFILNNLLHFGFVMLFVRGRFWWAEVFLVINWFNLSSLYFRHNAYDRFIHLPAVSGPLAWTFVAIYWNGGIAVPHSETLVARIFANVFVWSILVYGLFFVFVYKDYTMGFCLSALAAAIGTGQFLNKLVALQWIFAFIVMSILFVFAVLVAIPAVAGGDVPWARKKTTTTADAEREPLLGGTEN